MATISLCMIVKDEEQVLGRCLDSVREAVDEIVIVDTGSRDRTKEIAKGYTDRIYDFQWIDDFSAARNFSFSKGNGDFLFWLDADDVLEEKDRQSLIRLKDRIPSDVSAVMMPYHTAFDEEGRPVFSFERERLIRREAFISWQGRVHEVIAYRGKRMHGDVCVTHRSVKRTYPRRNLRIYEKQEEAGEPFSPRDQFYYGRELYYHKLYDRAIQRLEEFLSQGKGWKENCIEACRVLSYCYREKGNTSKAMGALTASFYYDEPRAEVCCEIGELFMSLSRYETAVFWYELALKLPEKNHEGAFVSEDARGYLPCIQLCVCHDRLGNREKAIEYNLAAGRYRPRSEAYRKNLSYFGMESEHLQKEK